MSLQPGSNRLLPFGTGWQMLRVTGLMPTHDGQLKITRVPDPLQGMSLNKVMGIFNRNDREMQVTRSTAVTSTRSRPNRPAATRTLNDKHPKARLAFSASADEQSGSTQHLIYIKVVMKCFLNIDLILNSP